MRRTQSQDTWSVLQRMGQEEKRWLDRQMSKLGHAELEKCRIALAKPAIIALARRASVSPTHRKIGSIVELGAGNQSQDIEFRHASVKRTFSSNETEDSPSPTRQAQRLHSANTNETKNVRRRLASRQVHRLSGLL